MKEMALFNSLILFIPVFLFFKKLSLSEERKTNEILIIKL